MISNIFDQLRRDEGTILFPYRDTAGKTTIGTGRNLTDCGISEDEKELMFQNDVKKASVILAKDFPWADSLDEVRRGAMLNLVFNMQGKLLTFVRFIAAMKAGNWAEAKAQLLDSAADHEEPDRITRLGLQIESGFWQ